MMRRGAAILVLLLLLAAPNAGAALFRDHAVATTTVTGGASSVSIAKPATAAVGDLMIAVITLNSNTITVTAPSAKPWTAIAGATAVAGTALRQYAFHRWVTSSEDASFVFTFSASTRAVVAVVAYQGVLATDPFGTTSTQAGTASPITVPAATTTMGEEVLVGIFALARNSPVIDDPVATTGGAPAMTPRFASTASSGGGGAHLALRIADAVTGTTTGTQSTYTASHTSTGTTTNLGTIIALKPSPDLTVGADPVGADGVVQTGVSWGAWDAQPGASDVASLNYFKITNTGVTPSQPFIVSFSAPSFVKTGDAAETIPITNNIQFAWCEDTTPATSSPSECGFTFGSTSATGSVTGAFSAVGNIVYVTYRLVSIPDPTVEGSYQASFTIGES